ncbi:MAG: hypothetical protein EPN85_10020 [Bacteroidetes bacterium]|nr:MAG: hypothetical protein EPN85_10020 [Bacteroidota bacterium]
MNTKTILNIAAFALMVIGLSFKSLHWPGSATIVILSAIIMLVSLFMFAVKDNKEAGVNDALNYFLSGTVALWIIGAIFKFQHWPAAGIFVIVAYVLSVALPIILIAQKDDFKVSRQFLITFFTFFLLLLGTLHHNPISKFLGSGGDYIKTTIGIENDSTTVTHSD